MAAVFLEVEVEPSKIDRVANKLMENQDIAIVAQHTGNVGLHVHAYIESVDKLSDFLDKCIYSIDGVKSVSSNLLIRQYKTHGLDRKILTAASRARTKQRRNTQMWEFKFYSRGGQGAVTAAKILINAAIIEGKYGQAIPSYGQERKGAPVYTYARIAEGPIDVKSYVYRPNCVICFDTSLADLGIDITEGVRSPAPRSSSTPTTRRMKIPPLKRSASSTRTR